MELWALWTLDLPGDAVQSFGDAFAPDLLLEDLADPSELLGPGQPTDLSSLPDLLNRSVPVNRRRVDVKDRGLAT